MSESSEQIAVIEWCDWHHIPIFHIPNGGTHNKREAANLKRQGVRSGIPDLCIPVARGGYHGLYIEMKDGTNKPTANQIEWLKTLSGEGYKAAVCWGAKEAIPYIESYINSDL